MTDTRVAPATFWEEPNARKAAALALLGYPTYDAATGWSWSTLASEQDGTFTLLGSDIVLDPGAVSGGRAALLGSSRVPALLVTPTSITLASYSAGQVGALTLTRADTATYVAKTGD